MECPPGSTDVERVANGLAVGPQSAPLAERLFTSMCRPWRHMPTGPARVPPLADDAGAQRRAHSAGAGHLVPPHRSDPNSVRLNFCMAVALSDASGQYERSIQL